MHEVAMDGVPTVEGWQLGFPLSGQREARELSNPAPHKSEGFGSWGRLPI